MNTERLYEILKETTMQLRKGEVVEGTSIYMMPHESEAPDNIVKVDCHFVVIGVDKEKAEQHKTELIGILDTYPEPERLAGGPSYIEVGAVIGDQGATFQLYALGEVLGLWKVITPELLGVNETTADQMAGMGMIMISGYKKD